MRRMEPTASPPPAEARELLVALDRASARAREAAVPVQGLLPLADELLAVWRIAAGAPASSQAWNDARAAVQRSISRLLLLARTTRRGVPGSAGMLTCRPGRRPSTEERRLDEEGVTNGASTLADRN